MARQKSQPVATPAETEGATVAQSPNGEATDAAEKEKTVITEYTLKLQRHRDVDKVPDLLGSLEDWAKETGRMIQKKETSTPGYYSWVIHTTESFEAASKTNITREIRSLREDEGVKAQASKLGISVDDLLKRALANVREGKVSA